MNRFAQHSVPDALKRMNRNRNQRKRKMNVKKIAIQETRRRMARERRGAESSVVSMETLYYKIIY